MRRLGLVVLWLVGLEVVVRLVLAVPGVVFRLTNPVPYDLGGELRWADQWWALDPARRGEVGVGLGARHDAELGWVPTPGVDGVGGDGGRGASLPRRADAVRVVLGGDSFTFGAEVAADATFAHQLEQRHRDLDVLNLGVQGYGLDQMAWRTVRDGARFAPDIVALVAIGDDIDRVGFRFFAYAKPTPTIAADRLVVTGRPVPTPREVAAGVRWRPRVLDLVGLGVQLARRHDVRYGARRAEVERIAGGVLEAWADDVVALGAVPVVLYVPSPDELAGHRGGPVDPRPARDFFAGWCAGREHPCVDGTGFLDAAVGDVDAIRLGGHWNPSGHAFVADLVASVLRGTGRWPEAP